MYSHYLDMKRDIDDFLNFLAKNNINPLQNSYFEQDYLNIIKSLDDYIDSKGAYSLNPEERSALGGLHQLCRWISLIENKKEIHKIIPHLRLLENSAIRINSKVNYTNNLTGKADDHSNKLIETILAIFAIYVSDYVEIDDPNHSSGGTNPDIMFNYQKRKIAFACKTLQVNKQETWIQNIKSAVKQIDKSDCDCGYVVINTMNILDHDKIATTAYDSIEEPMWHLTNDLFIAVRQLTDDTYLQKEIHGIFQNSKAKPVMGLFIHSSTKTYGPNNIGRITGEVFATMLKCTTLHNFNLQLDDDFNHDKALFEDINNFIHNRLYNQSR